MHRYVCKLSCTAPGLQSANAALVHVLWLYSYADYVTRTNLTDTCFPLVQLLLLLLLLLRRRRLLLWFLQPCVRLFAA